ncbi:MAG: glycosyltransferase [Candidatus Gastranaerophilales bacterium]|nr:glycosyltransferase [Candidatus Gastranaerophilales bacterium]
MSEVQLNYPNRILLITDLYPIKDEPDIPLAIENFALALMEFGLKITVIRPNFLINTIIRKHKIYQQGEYERKGIKIFNRNFFLPFIFNNFYPDDKYDLIISHMPSGHIYADLLNKKLNLPRISVVHQSDYRVLYDRKYSFYFKNRLINALNNSDIIGARNSNLKNKLNLDFTLPSFVDKEDIIKTKEPNYKLKLITISRLIKRKNIDMVINALKDLKRDFEYEIYGIGPEKRYLEKLINKYELQDKIKLKGRINHHVINHKLDKSDIFILPSKDETFGLCYIEAMARGLITIAKKSESMDDIITNNFNGFLVNNSFDIKNILENIDYENMSEIMKNTIENIKNYEKEKIISKYLEIMQNCVAGTFEK